MEIWILERSWSAVDSGVGFVWELYKNNRPVAKSYPAHGEPYYFRKSSCIESAKRMRSMLFPELIYIGDLRKKCPIYDVVRDARVTK